MTVELTTEMARTPWYLFPKFGFDTTMSTLESFKSTYGHKVKDPSVNSLSIYLPFNRNERAKEYPNLYIQALDTLAALIKKTPSLKYVLIQFDSLFQHNSEKILKAYGNLINSIEEHPGVRELIFQSSQLTPKMATSIGKIIRKCNLTMLSIVGCEMPKESLREICTALGTNKTLLEINIRKMTIPHDCAQIIAKSLMSNPVIQLLDMQDATLQEEPGDRAQGSFIDLAKSNQTIRVINIRAEKHEIDQIESVVAKRTPTQFLGANIAISKIQFLLGKSSFAEASNYCVCAKKLFPDTQIHELHGYALLNLGDHRQALECFDHVLKERQACKTADVISAKILCLIMLKEHNQAVACYQEFYTKNKLFPKLSRHFITTEHIKIWNETLANILKSSCNLTHFSDDTMLDTEHKIPKERMDPKDALFAKANQLFKAKEFDSAIKIYFDLKEQYYAPAYEVFEKILKDKDDLVCQALTKFFGELWRGNKNNLDYQFMAARSYLKLAKVSANYTQGIEACKLARKLYVDLLQKQPAKSIASKGCTKAEKIFSEILQREEEREKKVSLERANALRAKFQKNEKQENPALTPNEEKKLQEGQKLPVLPAMALASLPSKMNKSYGFFQLNWREQQLKEKAENDLVAAGSLEEALSLKLPVFRPKIDFLTGED